MTPIPARLADQFVALLEADASALTRRRSFNTGGDTSTIRDLAATVQRVVPDARIEVTSAGERDMGTVTRVSDRALDVELGHKRRFTPLEAGVRAHVAMARARAGRVPVPA